MLIREICGCCACGYAQIGLSEQSSKLPPLIENLLKAGSYPHPVSHEIKLLQTHISYILLTDDLVYKIKKPVDFGFLDFTTLDRRKHFCGEELRLNQRGAPGLYLRVDPISRRGTEFHVGDGSDIVEYAVVMRRLPEEGLFSNMLKAGMLSNDHVRTLATALASYHQSARRVQRGRDLGDPDSVRRTMQDNYDHTAKFVGTLQSKPHHEQTKAFTDSQFAKFHGLMESRLDTGFVRECHGDLHLSNVCLWNDRVILFDCIEFNEPFRCIDVIQDASFVAMDLQANNRRDLAALFINNYVEQTGDYEGLQLLPLYLCRQAYVRAKVNSLLSEERELSNHEKREAQEQARHYYGVAWHYAQPRKGRVVLVSGVSGSGKSTIASRLASLLDAVHIRSDAVRKHLAGVPLDQKGNDAIYTAAMTEQTYTHLLELGTKLASEGAIVILDAKYDRRAQRQAVLAQLKQRGVPVAVLHCTAPIGELRRRLDGRHGDVSDATSALISRQLENFEPFDRDGQLPIMTIDTTQPFDAVIVARELEKP